MTGNEIPNGTATGSSSGWGVRDKVMAGAIAVLMGTNGYTAYRSERLQTDIQNLDAGFRAKLISEREATMGSMQETRNLLDSISQQLTETRGQSEAIVKRANQASMAAREHADQLAKRFAEAQKKDQAAVAFQLGELKQSAESSNTKVATLLTDVSNVRTEVAATRTDLDRTVSDLHSARGDMGVQSGLIATNAKELSALRALGSRNYYEFDLPKATKPVVVGGIAMQLKKVDSKRNRYTLEVVADDKKVEKKDKTINEPVQFYMAKARIPYEIVVNEVKRDRIVGYLATPKVTDAR
jgi:chromosome segregation ATPase